MEIRGSRSLKFFTDAHAEGCFGCRKIQFVTGCLSKQKSMSESLTESDRIMNSFNRDALDSFWRFIDKRQRVWFRRVVEGQSPPWTEDDILQKYRFTNVYRILDPGTQYVIQNILEGDVSREDKVLNVMMYRLIGRQETHEFLGIQSLDSFDPVEFERHLKHRRDEIGEPVFTGAYMVSGYNQMGSSDKVENVARLFSKLTSNEDFFDDVLASESLKDAYEIIRSQPGFGNFLSYQVLVDLLYPVNYYDGGSVLPFSPDDWSSPGPGAQKGLMRLVTDFNGLDQIGVMRWLRQKQREEFERLGLDFPYLVIDGGERMELSLADIQNCLCEFYKYDKILHSNGRARRCFRESEARSPTDLRKIYEKAPRILLPE